MIFPLRSMFVAAVVFVVLLFSVVVDSQPDVMSDVPTSTPTVTQTPTSSTLPPSYSERCYICGSEDKTIANPDQVVRVEGSDQELTCEELDVGEDFRVIPPELCRNFQSAGCDCTDRTMAPKPSPMMSDTPSDMKTMAPTILDEENSDPPVASSPTRDIPPPGSSATRMSQLRMMSCTVSLGLILSLWYVK